MPHWLKHTCGVWPSPRPPPRLFPADENSTVRSYHIHPWRNTASLFMALPGSTGSWEGPRGPLGWGRESAGPGGPDPCPSWMQPAQPHRLLPPPAGQTQGEAACGSSQGPGEPRVCGGRGEPQGSGSPWSQPPELPSGQEAGSSFSHCLLSCLPLPAQYNGSLLPHFPGTSR